MSFVNADTCINKYEGAEKLLKVRFFDSKTASRSRIADLRKLKRSQIDLILKLARCEIVAECHNQRQLSFILSESSLFISSNRIILKTCGLTPILRALNLIIQYALRLGFIKFALYYSHRSFLFPELQSKPHGNFRKEVSLLDKFCKTGVGYTFGSLNGDCWNLYCGQSTQARLDEPSGQTLELMMRDLNPANMELFYTRTSRSAEQATISSGIADLFTYGSISSYLFSPCGYSANGLLSDDEYFTIHVTPEPEFSYASFETNATVGNYPALISRILAIFQPYSFICTLLSDSRLTAYTSHPIFETPSYRCSELQSACIGNARRLTYMKYFRLDNRSEEAQATKVTVEMEPIVEEFS